jgi:2-iminobutanoate/2-iminopropanoate deaminase
MKKLVQTENAPQAIGPYSQAIGVGNLVFCSGQIPLDPKTGKLVEGDVRVQAHQVLKNLGAVLEAAGCSYKDVVKTTIYLQDLGQFQVVNEIYAGYFMPPFPARATVQVAKLPLGCDVEIDAIAVLPF